MTGNHPDTQSDPSPLLSIPKLGPRSLRRADIRDITFGLLSFCIAEYNENAQAHTYPIHKNSENVLFSDPLGLLSGYRNRVCHGTISNDDNPDLSSVFEFDSLLHIEKKIDNLSDTLKKSLQRTVHTWSVNHLQKGVFYQTQKDTGIPGDFSDYFFYQETKREQNHCTPFAINQLLAGLLSPDKGMHIYDPACGSGGSLLACAMSVRAQNKNDEVYLYGHETNMGITSLARKNLYIHGIGNSRIAMSDAVTCPFTDNDKNYCLFDLCISELPRAPDMSLWKPATLRKDPRFPCRTYRSKRGEGTFIEQMMYLLKPEGKMAVITTPEFLYCSGSEKELREKIINDFHLISVIYLPEKILFSSHESPALLIIGKEHKSQEKTLFIDASRHYIPGYGRNCITRETIETIWALVKEKKEREGLSSCISTDMIQEEDFRLTVSRYVDSFSPEKLVNVRSVLLQLQTLEGERKDSGREIDRYLEMTGYST
ncbi:MAG: N-6 DNA methylase [Methanospirillaceae archaeon]|nr:N-6 DNA methylase [Methanospirillaceae archaeon]